MCSLLPARAIEKTARPTEFYARGEREGFFKAAWALVHILMTSPDHIPDFREYQRNLIVEIEPGQAWSRVFDDATTEELGEAFARSLASKKIPVMRVDYEPGPTPAIRDIRNLSGEEVFQLWARSHLWTTKDLSKCS